MSDELKACPWCGSPADRYDGPNRLLEYVGCDSCGRTFPMSVDEWNNRPSEDALRTRLEKAEAALREYADSDNWARSSPMSRDMDLYIENGNGSYIARKYFEEAR